MTPYRVLVVDDRPEMRDLMRSTVETLGSGVNVLAVPSGEEALLEIQLQHFDLLISDVLLAGINGIELMRKARSRSPTLKVILVTGVTDPQLRQAAADAGADKFFPKPISTGDLIDTVASYMEQEESAPLALDDSDIQEPNGVVSDPLAELLGKTGAIAVILTDVDGQVKAEVGDLTQGMAQPDLFPLLMDCLNTGSEIARLTGSGQSRDLMYFNSPQIDIYAVHVDKVHKLVMVVDPTESGQDFGNIVDELHHAAQDLQAILLGSVEPVVLEGQPENHNLDVIEDDLEVEASKVDALFKNADGKIPGNQDVEAFWDLLAQDSPGGAFEDPDTLSYDQALQLGLTSGDDKD